MQPIGPAADRAHDNAVGRVPIAGSHVLADALPDLAEPNEVRVRIEDDQPQRRLQQELLENRAEGVRLPGAGLSAEERVPVEPAGVEPEAHARPEDELADVEGGAPRARPVEPPRDGLRVRPHDRGLVERAPVAVEDDAVAAGEGDAEVGRVGDLLGDGGDELRAFDPGGLDRVHLAEAPVDRGVAAGLQHEVLDRALEREAPAVDRRRDRRDRGLELLAGLHAHACDSLQGDGLMLGVPRT